MCCLMTICKHYSGTLGGMSLFTLFTAVMTIQRNHTSGTISSIFKAHGVWASGIYGVNAAWEGIGKRGKCVLLATKQGTWRL